MVKDQNFYEESWKKWEDMKKFGPASLHNRRILLKLIKPLDYCTVVDVGCGEGSLIQVLSKQNPGKYYYGLDLSRQAIVYAKQRVPFAEFSVLDIQEKYLKKKFDLIIASEILEHLELDLRALKNMRKMCNRYLVIYTLTGQMRTSEKRAGHVRNYSQEELVTKIKKAGFKIIKIVKWGFPFYSPLYRNLLEKLPEKATTGRFSTTRKLIARLIYYLFYLNSFKGGDVIAVLAEVA